MDTLTRLNKKKNLFVEIGWDSKKLQGGGVMKRDARIGMAVVLVLGLSVTLLAGRAL